MKRLLIPAIMLFAVALLFIGCSNEKMIENTIDDWTNAINDGDVDALTDVVSPDSEWYDPVLIQDVINTNFYGLTPISYDIVEISVNEPYADVPAKADYKNFPNINALFQMKKEAGFLSFLFPKWKVFKCWSDLAGDGIDPINDADWRRLK